MSVSRDFACHYIDKVHQKLLGEMYGVSCNQCDPTPYVSYYRALISGCETKCIPKVPQAPSCEPSFFGCEVTVDEVDIPNLCSLMWVDMPCCNDIILPPPPSGPITGPWRDDQDAAANGVLIGQEYYLSIDNNYGIPVGTGGVKKTRTT